MSNSTPTPTPPAWHSLTLRIPFLNADHAHIAKRSLDIDREQNAGFVDRTTTVDGDVLVVSITATSVRLLRLASNSFLSSVDLVLRTMEEFAPDPLGPPPLTDAELEADAQAAREHGGGVKGIELKYGQGAGGGEEVQ